MAYDDGDKTYVVDVGGPWTSDKGFVACKLCGCGGVYVLLSEKRLPVHKECYTKFKYGGTRDEVL